MKANQELIATELQISRSTVSRSLSGHPSIHPETRARVLAKAEEMGYLNRERMRGRISAERKLTHVGVMIATGSFANSPHPEAGQRMLVGLSDAAAAMDCFLDTHFIDAAEVDQFLDVERRPMGWRTGNWRGAILIYQHSLQVVEALLQKMPVVSLVNQYMDLPVDCIDSDPFSGMDRMVRALAERGHRRLAFLSIPKVKEMPSWVYSRYAGFIQSITRMGLEYIPEACLNITKGLDVAKGDEAGRVLKLWEERGVTAVVCATDYLAFRLIRGLREQGVSVPGDLSVTGFDGAPEPADLPKLCTIQTPLQEMGAAALTRLRYRIQKPGRPIRHTMHQGKFSHGESVSEPHFNQATPNPGDER